MYVKIVSKSAAFVSGPLARTRLVECGAKSPMWLPNRRVWATSPRVARDLIALCDAERIPVEFIDVSDDAEAVG
ncbi:hypothetical protein FE697_007260 [Mumia zhuanghuii]|uniref:Uncharacterized protein n=2 Tax=Mumia TaxID=1546255 RepID=A0ABW1QK55_9ACTN|nr:MULTISPECIES: hypothetical protein [Mumia]KAA1423402.1 hypothetical protein FE697_007260 [Mumia zhuanghuii]